jgi:nitrogen fixation/metabolism regulation signal transduction histidine kinase
VAAAIVALGSHNKWEVRRAVAGAAACCRHPLFEPALSRLASDQNARVQQAARDASFRRRDWRTAGLLGRQHEARIALLLDDIHSRFGSPGRAAVKRASEEIADTFARELYHEVIKLLTPLLRGCEDLQADIAREAPTHELANHATRIERDASQLKAVLDAMRAYTAVPTLQVSLESLSEAVQQAGRSALAGRELLGATIENQVGPDLMIEMARPRLIQALTNLLCNALEAYDGMPEPKHPIVVEANAGDGYIVLTIRDRGCGMSPAALAEAPTFFVSRKTTGTGFGLPLAMKIVESEHRGMIDIESEEGVGTVVRVRLPRFQRTPNA